MAADTLVASGCGFGASVDSPNRLMYVRLPSIDTKLSSPAAVIMMSLLLLGAPNGLILIVCRPLFAPPFPGPCMAESVTSKISP